MINKDLQAFKKSAKEEFDAKDSGKIRVKVWVRTGDDEDFGECIFVYFDRKKMANAFIEDANEHQDTFARIV